MELNSIDTYGQRVVDNYSVILTDPTLEKRIKFFDPNLKLMFDQSKKRWTVMEWATDNSGWNCILIAEDKDGNPEPLGDWVLQALKVKRAEWEKKMAMGANNYFKSLMDKAEAQKRKMAFDASDDNQAMIREDIMQWRKASRQIEGGVPSDVTAGYRKI